METFKHHWRAVIITIGTKLIETATFFIFATFTISYATNTLGYARSTALNAVLIAAVLAVPVMLLMGRLSDRIGRKKVFMAGVIAIFFYAIPFFWLISQKSVPLLILALLIGFSIIWSSYGAVIGTMFAENFSPDVRYTGISLGYQVGAALIGGPAPLIATALLIKYDSYIAVGVFIMIIAVDIADRRVIRPRPVRRRPRQLTPPAARPGGLRVSLLVVLWAAGQPTTRSTPKRVGTGPTRVRLVD